MGKVSTTLTLDIDIKKEVQEILKEEGVSLSFLVDTKLKEFIEEYKEENKRNRKEVEDVRIKEKEEDAGRQIQESGSREIY